MQHETANTNSVAQILTQINTLLLCSQYSIHVPDNKSAPLRSSGIAHGPTGVQRLQCFEIQLRQTQNEISLKTGTTVQ